VLDPTEPVLQMCVLGKDGKIRWSKKFLALLGNNKAAAAKFAGAAVFGFGPSGEPGAPLVGRQSNHTFTRNAPGSIDVTESDALDSARLTHGLDKVDAREFAPRLPVEFFRDMRRAVLVTAWIPVSLIVRWRDDVGLCMYDSLMRSIGSATAEKIAHRKKEASRQRRAYGAKRGWTKRRVISNRKRRAKTEAYGEELKRLKKERLEARKLKEKERLDNKPPSG
jgi:hypothetical protein